MASVAQVTAFDAVEVTPPTPVVVPHVVTAGTTILVVALFDRTGASATALSLTYNGNALTNVAGYTGEVSQFWYLLNPPVGSYALSIVDSTYQIIVEGAIYNVHGAVNTVTPFGSLIVGVVTGVETTVPVSVPSNVGDLVFDCAGVSSATVAVDPLDPGIGQTELFDRPNVVQTVHRAAGSVKVATGVLTAMEYSINNPPGDVMFTYIGVALHVIPGPAIPQNVHAQRRANYVVVHWDPTILDESGDPVTVTAYQMYRSTFLNETDQVLLATVDTLDAAGDVDTAFVDTSPTDIVVYRVVAVDGVVQSDLSERAVATYAPSPIDEKVEHIDQVLLFWDEDDWDESLWS
jgi:hypothetical protein